jgi:DNA-binding PadR family transcriptional regulator
VIHIEDYYAAVLGEFEQLVLLALVRLGNGAYGASMARLEKKKLVVSYVGEPSRERGGRRRKHYILNDPGQRALGRAYRAFKVMTQGIEVELEGL